MAKFLPLLIVCVSTYVWMNRMVHRVHVAKIVWPQICFHKEWMHYLLITLEKENYWFILNHDWIYKKKFFSTLLLLGMRWMILSISLTILIATHFWTLHQPILTFHVHPFLCQCLNEQGWDLLVQKHKSSPRLQLSSSKTLLNGFSLPM